MSNRDHDGDPFEEFAPRDQGFSLLRTKGQTIAWYARSAAIPVLVGVLVLAVAAHAVDHPKTPKAAASTTTTAAPTTTTTKASVTTTTKPRIKKKHTAPTTTTTTQPKHVVTTTTQPASTTTTTTAVRPPVTTTTLRPVTTTTKPPTTTTTAPKQTSYTVKFTCAGGETVTVSGTGPSASNSLSVIGPIDNFASGQTATVSFTAVAGTYVATDQDASGGAYVNYISSSGGTACS